MKLTAIRAFDIPDSWYRCVKACLRNGHEYTIQRGASQGDKRRGLDNVAVTIMRPATRPLVPDVPEKVPAPTSMEFVYRYLAYLITPEKQDEEYTYGQRISPQLEEATRMLKETPITNQCCIEVGQPSDMFLKSPPCLRLIDCRVRYGKLHFFAYFRSWDCWGGYPANMAALQLLKEHMAKQTGTEDGTLNAYSKGLHLYSAQWGLARKL